MTTGEVTKQLEDSESVNSDEGETRTVSFVAVVTEPPLAMGTFEVESSYSPLRASAGPRIGVRVKLDVLAVTKIDSKQKTVGLHMEITLVWQDPSIVFNTREPEVNEEFEYSPDILK